MEFIPNWQRMGLASREAGWKYVVEALVKERKTITSHSLSNEADFILGDEMFVVKGAKRVEKN